jgi:hypothetical protein
MMSEADACAAAGRRADADLDRAAHRRRAQRRRPQDVDAETDRARPLYLDVLVYSIESFFFFNDTATTEIYTVYALLRLRAAKLPAAT